MGGQSRYNSIFAGGGTTLRAHSRQARMERDSIDPWADRSNGVLPAVLHRQMERWNAEITLFSFNFSLTIANFLTHPIAKLYSFSLRTTYVFFSFSL